MNRTDKMLQALVKCALADSVEEKKQAQLELQIAVHGFEKSRKDPDSILLELMLEIGVPDHMIGYPYVISAVKMLLEDPSMINRMTTSVYPGLAAQFNTKAPRVERSIRNVIERTWITGDLGAIDKYFGNIVNPEKGRPTCSEFIARLANIVRMEMQK